MNVAKQKLPHAKDWQARDIADWNTITVVAYMQHIHDERLHVPYFPFATWQVERKMIKTCIDDYGAATVKVFIDECIRTYTPTADYPGINFGFMFKYRNRELQRIISEQRRDSADKQRQAAHDALVADDDDLDWI